MKQLINIIEDRTFITDIAEIYNKHKAVENQTIANLVVEVEKAASDNSTLGDLENVVTNTLIVQEIDAQNKFAMDVRAEIMQYQSKHGLVFNIDDALWRIQNIQHIVAKEALLEKQTSSAKKPTLTLVVSN